MRAKSHTVSLRPIKFNIGTELIFFGVSAPLRLRPIKFNIGTEPELCEDADNVEDKTY